MGLSDHGTAWMRLTAHRMTGSLQHRSHHVQQLLAGEIAARIWQQSIEEDRVQHVRIRPADPLADDATQYRLDVGILLMADSDDKAHAVGARLCTGALAAGPDTVGWTSQPLR